ncbi:MAG TPA: TetR/AcrR family transcriptional regulator [Planctomycetota bacterium]|nr:TetR/AcrR family transcriptional regulator [Planctomycetota bacterium]
MAEPSTRDRILDAAEALYAEQGIAATSLRAITRAAGVNLAAVNYHFGSKRGLTEEVFGRRVLPLTRERFRLLEEAEARARGGVPGVEDIVRAFVLPALRLTRAPGGDGERIVRLVGRVASEPYEEVGALLPKLFEETFQRFVAALARALPRLSAAELSWRFHFMVGSLVHTILNPDRICRLSDGHCQLEESEGVSERLVVFIAAGLEAPPASSKAIWDAGDAGDPEPTSVDPREGERI